MVIPFKHVEGTTDLWITDRVRLFSLTRIKFWKWKKICHDYLITFLWNDNRCRHKTEKLSKSWPHKISWVMVSYYVHFKEILFFIMSCPEINIKIKIINLGNEFKSFDAYSHKWIERLQCRWGQEHQQKQREAPSFSRHNPMMKAVKQSYSGTPDGTFTKFHGLIQHRAHRNHSESGDKTWKMIRQTICLVRLNGPIRFVTTKTCCLPWKASSAAFKLFF